MEELTGLGRVSAEDEEQLAALLALYARQGHSRESTQSSEDACCEASLDLGVQPALPEEQRGTKRLVMKRKVLRHRPDGGVEISDESENDPEVWSLRQKMLQPETDDSISEGEMETSSSIFPRESEGDSPLLLRESRSRSSRTSQCSTAPKSFIPPRLEPLGHHRGKTDCVAKYFDYKREWDKFGIPGENPRLELRRSIREQMRCPPELPARAPQPCVPNTYIVPTEKKRAALRWAVRWELAKGLLPRGASRWLSKAHSF
ncbi:centriolar and ciliogenesis-associated protein HYLS1 [Pogoniulus pusillus]|uniref:centriolar and ciliogenesis-associated protein HYLS1 n=1 Tax=Pogoniulus pusillus TaxID=488313 RepID=UPI0030B9665A